MSYSNVEFLKRRRLRGTLANRYFMQEAEQEKQTFSNIPADTIIEQTPVTQQNYNTPNYSTTTQPTNNIFQGKGTKKITMEQYLNAGGDTNFKGRMTTEQYNNAAELIDKTNKLISVLDLKNGVILTSGGRTKEHHRQIYQQRGQKAPEGSAHLSGQALDIYDPDGSIKKQLINNPRVAEIMKREGIYIENPNMTGSWLHIQTKKPGYVGNEIWGHEQIMRK